MSLTTSSVLLGARRPAASRSVVLCVAGMARPCADHPVAATFASSNPHRRRCASTSGPTSRVR
eukprot:10274856-Lingulodinium_polyedra.AAC.1